MRTEPTPPEPITAEAFFTAIGALLEPKRLAFGKVAARYAFAVIEGGRYLIDPGADRVVSSGWDEDAHVLVILNERTIADIAAGRFDPDRPKAHHVFLASGDRAAFGKLGEVLGGAKSWLGIRMGG